MITQERLKELFYYKDGNLYRRISRGGKMEHSLVGYIWVDPNRDNHKYVTTKVDSKEYKVHRLIWMYHYGNMPENQIDHINGDSLDNRIENMRDVNNGENSKNRCIQSNNSTGYHGITMHKGRYRVRINVNKKRISCGVYDTFEEALNVRKELEKKYNYHNNHGRVANEKVV